MSDVTRVLGTPEGLAATKVLVGVIEGVADYIAGRRDEPPELPEVPSLRSELALERARFRARPGGSGG